MSELKVSKRLSRSRYNIASVSFSTLSVDPGTFLWLAAVSITFSYPLAAPNAFLNLPADAKEIPNLAATPMGVETGINANRAAVTVISTITENKPLFSTAIYRRIVVGCSSNSSFYIFSNTSSSSENCSSFSSSSDASSSWKFSSFSCSSIRSSIKTSVCSGIWHRMCSIV